MFQSQSALNGFLTTTRNIKEDDLKIIQLGGETNRLWEKMVVLKDAPTVPVGYITQRYEGIQPGRGKVYSFDCRPA